MISRLSTTALAVCALLGGLAGCRSLSFPSLPSFSLLDAGTSSAPSSGRAGVFPLSSRPGDFRYDDALPRITLPFARGSYYLEETALARLAAVSEALADTPGARVLMTGFTTRGAAPGADRVLGEQRALAVRAELTRAGIAPGQLHTTSFGSDRPPAGGTSPADQVDLTLFPGPEPPPPSR